METDERASGQRCSELSRAAGESLRATAPENAAWLLVEQAPPWGRDALLESGIAPAVATELARRAKTAGVKVLLVRRNGDRPSGSRRAFIAWTGADAFVSAHALGGDEDLLELDLERLAAGWRLPGGEEVRERMTLVCTNGRRDACCALHGCRAADALGAVRPHETWQCSHIGGHRFAATMLCLPSGACFGRLGPAAAVRAVEALDSGVVDLRHLRGFVGRPAAVQAAEAILRERHGLERIDDVTPLGVERDGDEATVRLRTSDGLEHVVRVELHEEPARSVSCSGEPEPVVRWVAAQAALAG